MGKLIQTNTVYRIQSAATYRNRYPSIMVTGGTVDVYLSIAATEPVDETTMVKKIADFGSLNGDNDFQSLEADAEYLYVKVKTGSPVVHTTFVRG